MPVNQSTSYLEHLLKINGNLSACLDLHSYVQSVIEVASEANGSKAVSKLEIKGGNEQFDSLAALRFHQDMLKTGKVPINASVSCWAYQNTKSVFLIYAATEQCYCIGIDRTTDFDTRSFLTVPIISKGGTFVLLEVVK